MRKCQKKGYVLISVLVIMMVLVTMMYFFSDALFSEMAISRNQKAATQSFHLAEAGVQEAIWRIRYDSTTKNTFLYTSNGTTTFNHNPALLAGGSYQVTIQNTAKATATITATGFLQMGLKTAQRRLNVKVTKATGEPPYEYYGAIFTGGATGNEDIRINNATLNVTGDELVDHDNDPLTPEILMPVASLISARNVEFDDSTISVAKDIIAKNNYIEDDSTVTVGGVITEHDPNTYTMPVIDVTSSNPGSYKSQAQAQNQYYDDKTFKQMLQSGPQTFTGIVYVAGGSGITIDNNESLTVNGMLVSEGSIDVGDEHKAGTLTINHVNEDPSGVIALNKFTARAGGIVTIEGLVYIGDRFAFDPYLSSKPASKTINIEGGILCRRLDGSGKRILNIKFNRAWINQAIPLGPDEAPIIQTQHWEEEY